VVLHRLLRVSNFTVHNPGQQATSPWHTSHEAACSNAGAVHFVVTRDGH